MIKIMVSLLIELLLSILICMISANEITNNDNNVKKGAIVTLTKYFRVDRLIVRNKHLYDNLYKSDGSMDVIIFHERDIDLIQQKKIQAGTPSMPIQFITVDKLFKQNVKPAIESRNPICPTNPIASRVHPGYKTMCAFWAYMFRKYLKSNTYDWFLRIDDDCNIKTNVKKRFPPVQNIGENIHIMSANWIIAGGSPDSLRDENPNSQKSGLLVKGLRKFTYNFAKNHNISRDHTQLFPKSINDEYINKIINNHNHSHNHKNNHHNNLYSIYDIPENKVNWNEIERYKNRLTWPSPATNTFYLNLTWLSTQPLLLEFMDSIQHSKCVYSNRWGDLPIWGSIVALGEITPYRWDVNVEHTSHKCVYKSRSHPLKYANPCLDVKLNSTIDYF